MRIQTGKTFADYGIDVPLDGTGEHPTQCPQCSHQRKKKRARCLSVNLDKRVWNCNHCGWAGSLEKGAHNPDYLHWAKPDYIKPNFGVPTDLPDKVVAYFRSRGIGTKTLQDNKIAYGPIYMPQTEQEETCIQFPYFRGGEVVNVKYRDGRKNFRLAAGAERILYGLDDISDKHTAVIVEGEMDKLSLYECGIRNCVSVPDGAPTPESKNYSSKFTFLDADRETIEAIDTWILAVDNDAAGKRLEDELSRRFGREKCKRVQWPEGCKDANETLLKHDEDMVLQCIDTAQPYPVEGVFTFMELQDSILNLYDNGWEAGVSSGWPELDPYIKFRPGEFTVVTGVPNSGKSNWVDCLMVNLAENEGWRFGVFSPENQPLEDHAARLIEKRSKKPFFDGFEPRLTREEIEDHTLWCSNHFQYILPDGDDDWTLDTILGTAKTLVYRFGIRGLVIDPWNELEHLRPMNQSETEYIGACLKRIRQFGRKYGVHVFVVAHPTKIGTDLKEGKMRVPNLYDIAGSANWRNKCDNGIVIYRDIDTLGNRVVEAHIQKVRFKQNGKVGTVEQLYNRYVGTYHNIHAAKEEIDSIYKDVGSNVRIGGSATA